MKSRNVLIAVKHTVIYSKDIVYYMPRRTGSSAEIVSLASASWGSRGGSKFLHAIIWVSFTPQWWQPGEVNPLMSDFNHLKPDIPVCLLSSTRARSTTGTSVILSLRFFFFHLADNWSIIRGAGCSTDPVSAAYAWIQFLINSRLDYVCGRSADYWLPRESEQLPTCARTYSVHTWFLQQTRVW